jgi:mannose-6-phosphate isomerase-like protein (cupin superfamily)
VDEVWWFVQGRARVWRSVGSWQEVVDVGPSTAIAVPATDVAPQVVEGRW